MSFEPLTAEEINEFICEEGLNVDHVEVGDDSTRALFNVIKAINDKYRIVEK